MLKKVIYIIGLTSIFSLILVGCGKGQSSNQSDKSYGAGQTSKKSSSLLSTTATSSTSSSKSSQSSDVTASNDTASNLDNKTVGVLAMLYNRPDYLKKYINDKESVNGIFYGTRQGDSKDSLNGYSFMTGEGDPTSYLYYKNENGVIKLKEWIPRGTVADGYFKSSSISLKQLITDYYSNQYKQNEVNGYVNKIKLDSDYGK